MPWQVESVQNDVVKSELYLRGHAQARVEIVRAKGWQAPFKVEFMVFRIDDKESDAYGWHGLNNLEDYTEIIFKSLKDNFEASLLVIPEDVLHPISGDIWENLIENLIERFEMPEAYPWLRDMTKVHPWRSGNKKILCT